MSNKDKYKVVIKRYREDGIASVWAVGITYNSDTQRSINNTKWISTKCKS